jgi:hypothetical protein
LAKFATVEEEQKYLRSIEEGERVAEEGNSMMTGWEGTTYRSERGMCVKWDNIIDGGQLSTALTHGTRRIRDLTCPFVQGIVAWGSNLKLTENVEPKSEEERVCLLIERETVRELIRRLKRAKATINPSSVD